MHGKPHLEIYKCVRKGNEGRWAYKWEEGGGPAVGYLPIPV